MRGKVRALLRQRCPDLVVPDVIWHTDWIAHLTAWGQGEQAVLDYLARYVFRVAITNARITGLDDGGVTFTWRDRKSGQRRACRLSSEEFMRRFLQHVLPRGLHKIRYFGLWHPTHREDAARMLQLQAPPAAPLPETVMPPEPADAEVTTTPPIEPRICPHCHQGRLIFIRTLPRRQAMGA
ncbi:transposase [Rhodovastum atsumiense]|uniref:transposase n=1 Tax=Rhodovastum atsumiense TaxID=504468 RepID=UPI00139F2BC9|nr:transposase [Rhodovastum atsumiense]